MRALLGLGWMGVIVATLGGVLLYLAGGMYVGILLVLVAGLGAAALVAAHLSRT